MINAPNERKTNRKKESLVVSSKNEEVSRTGLLAPDTLRCVVGSEQTLAFVSWEKELIAFPSQRLSHPV